MIRILTLAFVATMVAGATTMMTATSAEAACRTPNCWGAIAISTRTGAWGYVYNYPSRNSARRGAARKCRGRCNRVLTFRNSCGAYAVARNGGWGWGSGFRTRSGAERRALRECRARNPRRGCRIRVWACTTRR